MKFFKGLLNALWMSAIIWLIIIGIVYASPFLVCDPQTGVTDYTVIGPSWVISPVKAEADGSIKMDLAIVSIGDNTLAISACKTDPIWGRYCSDSTPFTFSRPTLPLVPKQLKLAP